MATLQRHAPAVPPAGTGGPLVQALRRLGLAGPVEYLGQVVHGVLNPRLLSSGASPDERAEPLPGDDVVPDSTWTRTRAATIAAPVEAVWPWLAQLGAGRGSWPGWYPFERPHDPAPDQLLPDEARAVRAGDWLFEVPGSSAGWRVVEAEPNRHLVLHSCRSLGTGTEVKRRRARRWADISWAFVLRPVDRHHSRLIVRTRTRFSSALFFWLVGILVPGDNVMQREMLAAIGRRAERLSSAGWPTS